MSLQLILTDVFLAAYNRALNLSLGNGAEMQARLAVGSNTINLCCAAPELYAVVMPSLSGLLDEALPEPVEGEPVAGNAGFDNTGFDKLSHRLNLYLWSGPQYMTKN